MKEEAILCLIVAYYEIYLDQDLIIVSLKDSSYQFLMYVWAFQKNYIGEREPIDAPMISYEKLF